MGYVAFLLCKKLNYDIIKKVVTELIYLRLSSEEVSKWPILMTYINGISAMSTIMRFLSVKMTLWLKRLHKKHFSKH